MILYILNMNVFQCLTIMFKLYRKYIQSQLLYFTLIHDEIGSRQMYLHVVIMNYMYNHIKQTKRGGKTGLQRKLSLLWCFFGNTPNFLSRKEKMKLQLFSLNKLDCILIYKCVQVNKISFQCLS